MTESKKTFFRSDILNEFINENSSTLSSFQEQILKCKQDIQTLPDLAKVIMKSMTLVFQDYVFGLTRTAHESQFKMDCQPTQNNTEYHNFLFPDEELLYITIDMTVFNQNEKASNTKFNLQSLFADTNHIRLDFYFYAKPDDMHTLLGYQLSTHAIPLGFFLAFKVDIKWQNDTQKFTLEISKYTCIYFKDTPMRIETDVNVDHNSLETLLSDLFNRLASISRKIYPNINRIQKERTKLEKLRDKECE